jgi:hypothetical protein
VDPIRRDPETKISASHHALGTITYADGSTGHLVYLKSSLTKDDPAEVLAYHAKHEEFPHQSTADQWFDESQFESYRNLGYYAATAAWEDLRLEYQLHRLTRKIQS